MPSFTKPINLAQLILLLTASQLTACASENSTPSKNNKVDTLFSETHGVLPAEERARRKWDGAIVGDLDGNGFQDLLLTEHAYKVFIYWNEGGYFSPPTELVQGDMHGTAIADFDKDGLVEVIIAQGGGNGSNPRKPRHYEITRDREITGGEQLSHFEKGRGRSVKVLDANNDGNLDLFLTGFATPEQFKTGANHFYSNKGAGQFTFNAHLPFGDRLSYRSSITDFNQDGESDIVVYGGKNIVLAKGGEGYSFTDATDEALGELQKISHASSISQIDFDGDGDYDWVISRSEHQFQHETYYDPETKRFAFFARFQPSQLEDLTIAGPFKLENLQMAYPHYDVFVGKDKRLLDVKAQAVKTGQSWNRSGNNRIELTQEASQGWPEGLCAKGAKMKSLPEGSKPGLYIGYVGDNKWRVCSQTQSATAGVINNVTSTPSPTLNPPLPAKLLENRNGRFVDVTQSMRININEQTTSALAADFNNDGWTDLFFMRYGNMAKEITQYLYLNNQGKSFSLASNHGVISTDIGATGAGAEVIDYDRDGDADLIIANERGKWHLFENHTNSQTNNHFLGIKVTTSPSKQADIFGAKAIVSACGRIQTRTVGDTASAYAATYNSDLLFGLGDCKSVDMVTISWSNGESKQFTPKRIDQYIDLTTLE
ncbi:CRTAC1 family protein [Shewanella sp. 10N.286.52.A9]|uniref:CRTAC1 family protein n=1 Tax=Shewanella sp. 10N.286.52.A9 TaxID=3229711 RepID=UPI00354E9B73